MATTKKALQTYADELEQRLLAERERVRSLRQWAKRLQAARDRYKAIAIACGGMRRIRSGGE